MDESLRTLLSRAADLLDSSRRVWACLVVSSRGSTPQSPGALMLVEDSGRTYGTIGGGCVESEVRSRALSLMLKGEPQTSTFKLDHDYGWDDGLICGGTIEVAIGALPHAVVLRRVAEEVRRREPTAIAVHADGDRAYVLHVPPRPRLYIAGAGHIGRAVACHGVRLDFEVSVFDDRPDLLECLEVPEVQSISGDIALALGEAPIDAETYCIVVTRGHRHDEQALHAVVNRGAGYVGMIGSRRKVKLIFDDLMAAGVPESALRDVHAPIGLDIGSVTVEEIAISIVAELISVRRGSARPTVLGPVPLAEARLHGAIA